MPDVIYSKNPGTERTWACGSCDYHLIEPERHLPTGGLITNCLRCGGVIVEWRENLKPNGKIITKVRRKK